jgi:hypothetical protein
MITRSRASGRKNMDRGDRWVGLVAACCFIESQDKSKYNKVQSAGYKD